MIISSSQRYCCATSPSVGVWLGEGPRGVVFLRKLVGLCLYAAYRSYKALKDPELRLGSTMGHTSLSVCSGYEMVEDGVGR